MIVAGPCLLNEVPKEVDNFYATAQALHEIDKDIVFRCKVIGGGTRPDRWLPGCRRFEYFQDCPEGMRTATEVHTIEQAIEADTNGVDVLWVGARNAQNYTLLQQLADFSSKKAWRKPLIVKRHPGMGISETWGLYDLYKANGSPEVFICERGINTFNRTEEIRWMPDFQFMAQTLEQRKDIQLMLDLSHCSFDKGLLFRYARAARAMGVMHYMVEAYADPTATQSDKAHALNMDEFRRLYDIIR